MADSVTYAHLQFQELASKDNRHGGGTHEDLKDEDEDVTYENVNGLQPPRQERKGRPPPSPALGRDSQMMAGFRRRSPHLCLATMLLCLILSASVIVLAMKYVQTSSDLQYMEDSHSINQNQSLQSGMDLLESVRKELLDTRAELQRSLQSNNRLSSSLQQAQRDEQTCAVSSQLTEQKLRNVEEKSMATNRTLRATEQKLRNVEEKSMATNRTLRATEQKLTQAGADIQKLETKLNQWRQDLCPTGWELFGKKCLWISKEKRYWANSNYVCFSRNANLFTAPDDYLALKEFFSNKKGDFWVGKKLGWQNVGNEWKPEWKWPETYYKGQNYQKTKDKCWKISGGNLVADDCWKYNYWVCEKNVLLTSVTDNAPSFMLWDTEYSCSKKSN